MNIIDLIPAGQDHAISRKNLRITFGKPDRLMRREIERARQEYAILNAQDGSGYFRPTPGEKPLVERGLSQERSRERSVRQSTQGAEKFLTGEAPKQGAIVVRSYTRRKKKGDGAPQIEGQMLL